jgi:hypothetical protein
MTSETRNVAAGLFLCASIGCVQSSNFEEPPPEVNKGIVDGEAVAFERVTMSRRAGGGGYGDGRLIHVLAGIGELTVILHLPDAAPGDRQLVPFGAQAVSATDGPASDIHYEGLAGSAKVLAGDGSIGSTLRVQLDGVRLMQTCTGEVRTVDDTILEGVVTEGELPTTLGVAGFVHAETLESPFHDPFPYVGPAGAQTFRNSRGIEFFHATTGEGCIQDNPRPTFHIWNIVIVPSEAPAGTVMSLGSSVDSFVFVNEVDRQTLQRTRAALAVTGTFEADADFLLEEGSVMSGTLRDLGLRYLDANNNFTTDPQLVVPQLTVRAIHGKPVDL